MRWDPSHVSPRVNHRGRECEPALFPYNKPVAWWGNLPVSQVTAAGRERDVLMLGAPPPPEGPDQGRGVARGRDRQLEGEVSP